MWDTHLHSKFSADSEADPKEIAKTAVKQKLEGICFTDHVDLDYPSLPEEAPFTIDWENYFKEITALQKNFPALEIRKGVEIGLQNTPSVISGNKEIAAKPELDFVIGSIHMIDGEDPYYGHFFEGKTKKQAYTEYFACTLENIKAYRDFDVLGHLDYMIRYYKKGDCQYLYSDYRDLIDEILKELISTGRGMEINSAGIRKGVGVPHPNAQVVRRYRELGGQILTLGSDAHDAKDIGADLNAAASLAKRCGFTYYTVFRRRRPEFYKL